MEVETESSSALPPEPPKDWKRCHAYLEQKRRFCRQLPVGCDEDSGGVPRFCGNHQHLLPHPPKRRRILCPLDPSHTVFEDQVERHLLVCPKIKLQRTQEAQPFYKYNLNAHGHGALSQQDNDGLSNLTFKSAKKLAQRVLLVHQQLFGSSGSTTIDPSQLSEEDIHAALPVIDLAQPELDAGLESVEIKHRIITGGTRHIHQRASLVGNLRRIGVLDALEAVEQSTSSKRDEHKRPKQHTKSRIILELGAGKGMTGLVVSGISAASGVPTKLLMIERAGTRGKAEKVFRKAQKFPVQSSDGTSKREAAAPAYPFNLASVKVERIKCDIAHVDIPHILEKDKSDGRQVVAIAKHLCGVGTDLALKSLEPIKDNLHSCILLMCCHGVCNWEGYVGRDFLRSVMEKDSDIPFGTAEFELMRKWSSGSCAVIDAKKTANTIERDGDLEHGSHNCLKDDEGNDATGISIIVKALDLSCGVPGFGRVCQRLIDYGRQEYLRNVLFSRESDVVEMLYYVPHSVTPQNAALVAYRKKYRER